MSNMFHIIPPTLCFVIKKIPVPSGDKIQKTRKDSESTIGISDGSRLRLNLKQKQITWWIPDYPITAINKGQFLSMTEMLRNERSERIRSMNADQLFAQG